MFVFEEEGREPTEEELEEVNQFYENDYVPSGCQEKAYENPGSGDQAQYQEFDEEFGDVMNDMYERIEASPEVVAYRSEVQACVEAKGFEYLSANDGSQYEYFQEKMDDVGVSFVDPLEGVDTEGWTDEQFQQAYENAETSTLPADMLAALGQLQAEEIETAVVHFECGATWQSESKIYDEVRIELEKQFLEDNADALAEIPGRLRHRLARPTVNRRIVLAAVAAVAILSAGVGWYAGQQIQSPAEVAAAADAPPASLITVPVEERELSTSVVIRGQVEFDDAADLAVSPSAGGSSIITAISKESGDELDEGDSPFAVAGRPTFVLEGELPVFRPLGPGVEGPDVRQLEEALARLGYDTGTVDEVYDNATEGAVAAFYRGRGLLP